jgi:uncharacterized protein (TIGR03435 family)
MRACVVAFILIACSTSAWSQAPQSATQPDPAFDVTSVKPNNSGSSNSSSRTLPGGGFAATNLTVRQLIISAYRLRPFQVTGGPDWIDSARFDIAAKAAPEQATTPVSSMLRSLLADRFKLRVHTETKEQPIYALVVARADGRLGPKLTAFTGQCTNGPATSGARESAPAPSPSQAVSCGMNTSVNNTAGTLKGTGQTLDRLATALAGFAADRMVVERTGLKGLYDIDLQWTPDTLRTGGTATTSDYPSLFTALQEQLGLKLESSRGPVEYVVVDSVERPSPD